MTRADVRAALGDDVRFRRVPVDDVVHRGGHPQPASPRRCTRTAPAPRSKCSSDSSGASSAAATRGSFVGSTAPARSRPARTARRRGASRRAARPRRRSPTIARCVNDTSRVEVTRTAAPAGDVHSTRAPQRARAHVEHALVRAELPVAHVERLVVDEQADELAVGDVDDRLARLRGAVARLGVRQRPQLVERVEVRAGQAVRLALVEVAAQADVPVREREQRLGLRQDVEVELGLADRHGSTAKAGCAIMALQELGEVVDDDVGAVLARARRPGRRGRRRRRSRIARRVRPRRPRARPRTRPPAPARRRARAPRRGTCRARACPRRCCSPATTPSTRASNRSAMPAAARTSRQFSLDETTARVSPASRAAARSDRAG